MCGFSLNPPPPPPPTNPPQCSHRVWSTNDREGCSGMLHDVIAQMVYSDFFFCSACGYCCNFLPKVVSARPTSVLTLSTFLFWLWATSNSCMFWKIWLMKNSVCLEKFGKLCVKLLRCGNSYFLNVFLFLRIILSYFHLAAKKVHSWSYLPMHHFPDLFLIIFFVMDAKSLSHFSSATKKTRHHHRVLVNISWMCITWLWVWAF